MYITINNTKYTLTIGSFGEKLINNMSIEKFSEWLATNDPAGFEETALKSIQTIKNNPEIYEDLWNELEFTEQQKQELRDIASV